MREENHTCYLDRLHGQRESIEVHEKKKIEILPVYFVKVKKLASIHQVSFHAFSSHSTFQYTGTLPSPHRLSSTDTEDALFSNKNTYPSRRYLSLISIKCGEVKSPVLKPHSRKITSENAHVEPWNWIVDMNRNNIGMKLENFCTLEISLIAIKYDMDQFSNQNLKEREKS